jgi:MFS superfamily sulfate permease-like transporter
MLRMLAVVAVVIVVVLVAAAVVKTFFWLTLIALIVGAICLALGFVRLGRRSTHRSRGRF